MMASHDSGAPAMPCEDCGDERGMPCAQHCAAVYAGMMVPDVAHGYTAPATSERITVVAEQSFSSQSGPPGLQPPR
jgi:hypothetical protein